MPNVSLSFQNAVWRRHNPLFLQIIPLEFFSCLPRLIHLVTLNISPTTWFPCLCTLLFSSTCQAFVTWKIEIRKEINSHSNDEDTSPGSAAWEWAFYLLSSWHKASFPLHSKQHAFKKAISPIFLFSTMSTMHSHLELES